MANEIRKKRILEYISRYYDENGYSPSYREIAKAVDLRSVSSVSCYINELLREGALHGEKAKPRSIVPNRTMVLSESVGEDSCKRVRLEVADGGSVCFDCSVSRISSNDISLTFSGIFDATRIKGKVGSIVNCFVDEDAI